ncbi:MAG: putative dehydrogenase [Pirellulaceae bacterium]|jgi:predicted dehydrogenase
MLQAEAKNGASPMNLTPEEKVVGVDNFHEAVGVHRRDFLKEIVAGTGIAATAGLGAYYFGYDKVADPVRIGVIGTGDEGNVLIGACNPDYVQVTAIADIRPSSIHRAFHGDHASPAALAARKGLMSVYGWETEAEARQHVKVFNQDNGGWEALLDDSSIEAVIIALPLHLHCKVAIQAMLKGKHVLTEKLMAHNVGQCKAMSLVAENEDLYLAVGHQRHYNILYDNAVQLMRWGLLGQIHYIRAQWHRGNLPGRDSWSQPIPGGQAVPGGDNVYDKIKDQLNSFNRSVAKLEKSSSVDSAELDLYKKKAAQWAAWDQDKTVKASQHGYLDETLPNGYKRSALEELVRWRLWERTGGGLMAELGSHQLDAASIFISSLRADYKENPQRKIHPLSVHAVGGRHIFPMDRDANDHVYCTFEYPGPEYETGFDVGYQDKITQVPPKDGIPGYSTDPNKKVIMTYSSINGNGFGGYGEIVMGTKGTLVIEKEKESMLYTSGSASTKVGVKEGAGGPTMDTQASGDMGPVSKAATPKDVSRGYREEIEHWAWCIRNKAPENEPRCTPRVGLGDAVIALTTNIAINNSNDSEKTSGGYVKFEDSWFSQYAKETSDGSTIEEELNKADVPDQKISEIMAMASDRRAKEVS